ncbi:MAG: GNAT family N-acetyltransferase [Tunicatimonas sp.]
MPITPAHPSDHALLTQLTLDSKAHWKYGTAQIEAWRAELTITAEQIATGNVYCLQLDEHIAGYYSYRTLADKTVELSNLFVAPAHIGKGAGRTLLHDFLERATIEGFRRVTLNADPNAEGFYVRHGFAVVGQHPSSIPGRFLPIMEKPLPSPAK